MSKRLPPSLSQTRTITELLASHDLQPALPEVTELPVDEGWQQWDLAVRLRDGEPA